MENEKNEECTECGTLVHWLEVFPQGRCVECHAVSYEGTRQWSASELRRAFGGAR